MTQQTFDLKKLTGRLQARRAELATRLQALEADQRRVHEALSQNSAERVTQRENDDVVDAIGLSVETELRLVREALNRVEAGTYGHCVSCGSPIGAARLRAVPYASRCSRCEASPRASTK